MQAIGAVFCRDGGRPARRPKKRATISSAFPKLSSISETVTSDRLRFIVDAAPYFKEITAALRRARRQIQILGWDIHSRLALERDGQGRPRLTLGELIEEILAENEELEVYILCWDFAPIYMFEREFMTRLRLPLAYRSRLYFELDGRVPAGGSQHQKVVVIDDAVAYVGGIDLTVNRWDTPAHEPRDPRRRRPDGEAFAPFHDAQVMVTGPAARALGALARRRWRTYDGREIEPPPVPDSSPVDAQPDDLEDVRVAIVETLPAIPGREEVRDTERWTVAAIEDARDFIYIENQYLTSDVIGRALERRLGDSACPEILIVNPREPSGWLEQATMGVVRARLLRRLRAADRNDCLKVLVPFSGDAAVYVHSKLLIVDDRLCYLGSANLSNRSMGLDTECGIGLRAADSTDLRAGIRRLRRRLLAEHLGVPLGQLRAAEEAGAGLFDLIERFNEGENRLEALELVVPEWLERIVPDSAAVDPEKPLEPGEFFERILAGDEAEPA